MLRKSHAIAAAAAVVLAAGLASSAAGAPFAGVPGTGSVLDGGGSELFQGPVQGLQTSIQAELNDRLAERKARQEARKAKARKYRDQVLRYSGGGRRWAIPYDVVVCESGVRGSITSGYYGILVSSWHALGGGKYADVPGGATHWEQSLIAAKIRDLGGSSGWSCWS